MKRLGEVFSRMVTDDHVRCLVNEVVEAYTEGGIKSEVMEVWVGE